MIRSDPCCTVLLWGWATRPVPDALGKVRIEFVRPSEGHSAAFTPGEPPGIACISWIVSQARVQKVARVYIKRLSQALDVLERDVAKASLYRAYVRPIDGRPMGQLFLG